MLYKTYRLCDSLAVDELPATVAVLDTGRNLVYGINACTRVWRQHACVHMATLRREPTRGHVQAVAQVRDTQRAIKGDASGNRVEVLSNALAVSF